MLQQTSRILLHNVRRVLAIKYNIKLTQESLMINKWNQSRHAIAVKKYNDTINYIDKIPDYYFTNEIF